LWDSGHIGLGPFRVYTYGTICNGRKWEYLMGIVNGNPMGMGIRMVGEWEWKWEWEGMGV